MILVPAGSLQRTPSSITILLRRNAFQILNRLVLRTPTVQSSPFHKWRPEVLDPAQQPRSRPVVLQQAGILSLQHPHQESRLPGCVRQIPSPETHLDRDLNHSILRRVIRKHQAVKVGLRVRSHSRGLNLILSRKPFLVPMDFQEWLSHLFRGTDSRSSRRCMHQCHRWAFLVPPFSSQLLAQVWRVRRRI